VSGALNEIRRLRDALERAEAQLAMSRTQTAALLQAADRDEIRPQLARERAAYERGRTEAQREAYERGRGDERTERDRLWNEAATPIARGGPGHAQLEERRYGPDGRKAFGQPRQGDYMGGPVEFRSGKDREATS